MIWIPGVKHPYMIRKTDGGFGYATTDLAALRHRVQVATPTASQAGGADIPAQGAVARTRSARMIFSRESAAWSLPLQLCG